MKKLALIAALVWVSLVLAPPSVQAQTSPTNATTNSQLANSNTANALGVTTGAPTGVTTGVTTTGQPQSGNRSPTTGVICTQEMTATFCNVPSGPNTNGYGSPGGSRSSGEQGRAADRDRLPRLHRAAAEVLTHHPSRPAGAFRRRTSCATDLQLNGLERNRFRLIKWRSSFFGGA
jgi:hypothetical protein